MTQPTFRLTPLRLAIRAGAAQTVPCLVTLTAEEASTSDAPAARPPLNLALVIDVSPSMSGEPIAQAREAAIMLLQRLAPTDRVALITYATTAEVLMPSVLVGEARDEACRRLAAVTTREVSTALHAGWLHGAQAIAPHVSAQVTSRILLLSDGQANQGETNTEVLGEATRHLLEETGITTSTYGVGNHFNHALMTLMGECGGGQAFYATEAGELAGYFDTELSLLTHSVARQVSAQVTTPFGQSVTWVTGRPNASNEVRLGDLVAGATSWALATVHVPATLDHQTVELRGQASWTDNAGVQHQASVSVNVTLTDHEGAEDPLVAERVRETEAARLQREASEAVARGNIEGARGMLRSLSAMAGSNAYVSSVTNQLSDLLDKGDAGVFQKEAYYAAHSMSTRQVSNTEDTTVLSVDGLGLRKSVQGRSASSKENTP